MRNLALIIFSFFLTLNVNAQWWGSKKVKGNETMTTITREVGNYDIISLGGPFDVILDSGAEGYLELRAEENLLQYIETQVSGKTLKIKIKDGINITSTKTMKITVPFEDLEEVNLSGSGDIIGRAPIKAKAFKTSVSGSGDLDLEVEAKEIDAKVNGSGNLDLRGMAKSVRYNVNGSGNLNAKRLNTKNAEVKTTGSGNVYVLCEGGTLKARTVGSGSIRYSGTPKKKDFKIAGSGEITSY